VIFTGDYTAMGTDGELAEARQAFQPLMEAPLGYVHVPGNHDLYLNDVIRQRRFERHFEDTLVTDLPEYRVDSFWPLVRLLDGVAVVAVNSARPNPLPWRSSGRIPEAQLDALQRIVRDRRVRERFVFVITHYAPRLADGSHDRRNHCLVNADAYLDVVAGLPRGAILCGHVHRCYRVRIPGVEPEIFCAGSATMVSREGFWQFDVDGESTTVAQGSWNQNQYTV
jgi:3',5'-cyclic AMP phosphodiesterase CpdA